MNFGRVISVIVISVVVVVALIGVAGLKAQASYIEKLERRQAQIEQDDADLKRQQKLKFPLAEDDL